MRLELTLRAHQRGMWGTDSPWPAATWLNYHHGELEWDTGRGHTAYI